ncbi:hypothetical protein [Arthrobacter sp. KNU40]|uniref:hypothetical protein n=1 Tax=Arthrobacter sp. KNU40 TaxID=3447965 RepID=UPI003F600D6D
MRRIAPVQEQVSNTPQDWTELEPKTDVDVIGPDGTSYRAVIDAMTPDSKIVWVRRLDVGSRHLLDHRDGVRIVPHGGGTRSGTR